MRADQIERLRAVQEKLADLFFAECTPEAWPKLDTKEGRGDRYWLKKNASASLAIIGRIENLLALRDGRASGATPPGDQERDDEKRLEGEIAAAEAEAEKLGRRVVVEFRPAGRRRAKG